MWNERKIAYKITTQKFQLNQKRDKMNNKQRSKFISKNFSWENRLVMPIISVAQDVCVYAICGC